MRTLLILAALTATPALAQTAPGAPRQPLPHDRGYDKPSARTDAINAENRAELAAANNQIAAEVAARPIAVTGVPVEAQARYRADVAAYRTALAAHDATLIADAIVSARQERAYADAMMAWRIQVDDCKRGVRAACDAPTPQPANYW